VIPTPKYAVGDTVFYVEHETVQARHACPDCSDTRQWTATSPAGETFAINCLRCATSYAGLPRDVPPLTYQKATFGVRQLTIGSVKIDTAPHYAEPVQYMCCETGVGSGRVYNESELFLNEADARHTAAIKASDAQVKLDAGAVNPIRAEAASWTLSAAFPHVWQEEIYHAWLNYRDLTEMLDALLKDDDRDYELNDAAIERIQEELREKPWRRPNPVATLIAAVQAFLIDASDESRQRLDAALQSVTPPELRQPVDAIARYRRGL
jgi:hypothetical protein